MKRAIERWGEGEDAGGVHMRCERSASEMRQMWSARIGHQMCMGALEPSARMGKAVPGINGIMAWPPGTGVISMPP